MFSYSTSGEGDAVKLHKDVSVVACLRYSTRHYLLFAAPILPRLVEQPARFRTFLACLQKEEPTRPLSGNLCRQSYAFPGASRICHPEDPG
jgi:hypothetical protein